MPHKDLIERRKAKPRGRPFQKKSKDGTDDKILDTGGHKVRDGRGAIIECENPETELDKSSIEFQLGKKAVETINKMLEVKNEEPTDDDNPKRPLQLLDSLEFKNGENVLTIRFSKKANRMFRIQVFLNDEIEIRPMTYTGSSMANAFWGLLQGAMKK